MSIVRLSLAIRNVDVLDNGLSTRLLLDQRGAVIGRSATADWSLPDPRAYVSSRHCEIAYHEGRYTLTDISTNGTFLNGAAARMGGPHRIADGDVIQIGHYEIVASLDGGTPPAAPEAPPPAWGGWKASPPPEARAPDEWGAPPPAAGRWGAPPPPAPVSTGGGWGAPPAATTPPPAPQAFGGALSHAWQPPVAAPESPPPGGSPWDQPSAAPATSSSPWSSAAPAPAQPSADDIWGRMTQGNVVDWARGGFGAPAASPLPTPAAPPASTGWDTTAPADRPPPVTAPPAPPPARPPAARAAPPPPAAPGAIDRFLVAAGIERRDITCSDDDLLAQAGGLLRRLVAGLVVMMEARARAKAQMGAQSTIFSRDGNNPIKFARTPQDAVAQLLNPPVGGFMAGDRAIEDGFRDLQAHQLATLKAMQGALRVTLDRYAPSAIRKRAEKRGLLARILPGARGAALWQAYEREFSGVAKGSEEAFLDTFAKEFRNAYEEAARG